MSVKLFPQTFPTASDHRLPWKELFFADLAGKIEICFILMSVYSKQEAAVLYLK